MAKPIGRKFYERNALDVAKNLLGCFIIRKSASLRRGKEIRAMIIDVEAYIGEDDLACHASKGRTARSEVLYGKAGHAYVYLIYGMYNIFNIVAQKKDFPAGIMIRGISIDGVDYRRTNGPGKVCKVLGIDRSFNNHDLTLSKKIWIEKGISVHEKDIVNAKRVGIDYAGHCAHYLWRFYIKPSKEK